ncbi:FecCD family ABC transporter permease [Anaerosacchariphilus polymeriproducens]|uniref:Iron ABC transporter permease n=1 Tax=Anaerosacchariphilus polymeriproducens TaxID=1812858 RepID=A0A371AXF5_9FIRM|nr:iron ABC transporter permease [Anaerosacchariphilus polymeriproducens]RDU24258.1 iron ABC transporter permease [Anaerosacchariphilus polymeriproducens]
MKKYKNQISIIFLFILLIVSICISLMLGRYEITMKQILQISLEKITGIKRINDPMIYKIIYEIRLPRIVAAVVVGGALSISGSVFQALFRNPMVSSDILGVTSGAGFGASLGILLGFCYWKVELLAFVFGIFAVMITYFLSYIVGKESHYILFLILSGMVISTLFKSFISCVKYLADPNDALQSITFWLMGSLTQIKQDELLWLIIPILLCSLPLLWTGWKLNAMAFGEEEAMALGIQTERLKVIIIICSTIITSVSVSMTGIIGWIGLIIPHLVRMAVGPDNQMLIPASMFMGAIYLLFIDNLSRTLLSVEIPISILTSIIGVPFFIFLLFRTRRV